MWTKFMSWLRGGDERVVGVWVEDERLPHEIYPQVLTWRKGDEFTTRDVMDDFDFYAGHATLLGLTMDGRVFLQDSQRLWKLSLGDVCKRCWNRDAYNREVSEEMKASVSYTRALSEFNDGVRELQRRDKQRGVDLPEKCYPTVPVDLYI